MYAASCNALRGGLRRDRRLSRSCQAAELLDLAPRRPWANAMKRSDRIGLTQRRHFQDSQPHHLTLQPQPLSFGTSQIAALACAKASWRRPQPRGGGVNSRIAHSPHSLDVRHQRHGAWKHTTFPRPGSQAKAPSRTRRSAFASCNALRGGLRRDRRLSRSCQAAELLDLAPRRP